MVILDGFRGGVLLGTVGKAGVDALKLSLPCGVRCSPNGELLCIADKANCQVKLLRTADFVFLRAFGSHGSADGQFSFPVSMCFSLDSERLFVADGHNDRVVEIRVSDGATLRVIVSCTGDAAGKLSYPTDVSISPCGTWLYIADCGNHRVQQLLLSDSSLVRSFGCKGKAAGQFRGPCGIALSPSGKRLFVTDYRNHRVQALCVVTGAHLFTIGGDAAGTANGQFTKPAAVCVSPSGEFLFVTDCGNHRVQVFSALDGGAHVRSFDFPNDGHLHNLDVRDDAPMYPCGICVAPTTTGTTRIIVVDGSGRICVFTGE